VSHIIRLAKDIAEDMNAFLSLKVVGQCCGLQLRVTPSEREYKEKMRENFIALSKRKAAGRLNRLGPNI
jgi:hypothetical protein